MKKVTLRHKGREWFDEVVFHSRMTRFALIGASQQIRESAAADDAAARSLVAELQRRADEAGRCADELDTFVGEAGDALEMLEPGTVDIAVHFPDLDDFDPERDDDLDDDDDDLDDDADD